MREPQLCPSGGSLGLVWQQGRCGCPSCHAAPWVLLPWPHPGEGFLGCQNQSLSQLWKKRSARKELGVLQCLPLQSHSLTSPWGLNSSSSPGSSSPASSGMEVPSTVLPHGQWFPCRCQRIFPLVPSCQVEGPQDTPVSASREDQGCSLARREDRRSLPTLSPTILLLVGQISTALSPAE